MSIRKIKRVHLNGARKDFNKHRKDEIKFELSPERDLKIEVDKEREAMARKFYDWQKSFINRQKTPEEIIDSLNHLVAIVDDTLGHMSELRASTIDIIYQKIQQSADLAEIVKTAFVSVIGQCVCHAVLKADAIPMKAWHARAFDLECEKCGYKLPAKECKAGKIKHRK